MAGEALEAAGFTITGRQVKVRGTGAAVTYLATDAAGATWYVDVVAAYTTTPAGLQRNDSVWAAIGRAGAFAATGHQPVLLLTSHLPRRPSDGDAALHAAGPGLLFDVVVLGSAEGAARLRRYAGGATRPAGGILDPKELDARA